MNITSTKGFTLLELLVSVAIVAIVAFVAVPNLGAMVEKNRTETTKSTLVNSIVAARSEAVSRNTPVGLCASANGTSCGTGGSDALWIAFADEDGDEVFDNGETVLGVYNGAQGVSLESSSSGVVFLSDGSVRSSVTLNVCGANADDGDSYEVVIGVTGRPRVERPGTCS